MPPTPGTLSSIRDALTARCNAVSASGSTLSSLDRVSSTAARASKTLVRDHRRDWRRLRPRAHGRSLLALPAAPGVVGRGRSTHRRPRRRGRRRSPRVECAAVDWPVPDGRCERPPLAAHGHAHCGWCRGIRRSSGGSPPERPLATSSATSRRAPRYSVPGFRSSPSQLAAASRRWPSAISASRSSPIHARNRGHSRSSASCANSTVGTRVSGMAIEGQQPGLRPAVDGVVQRGIGRLAQRTRHVTRRRVGSPSALTTTSCSNICRTAARSASSRAEYINSAREAMAPSTPPSWRYAASDRRRSGVRSASSYSVNCSDRRCPQAGRRRR